MFSFNELRSRMAFWSAADRLGPDMLSTHWRLYFKSTMREICEKKFRFFGAGAEFRPGAYAEACSKIDIGDHVIVRPGTYLFADPTIGGGGISIEAKVLLGAGVHLYTNNHRFSDPRIAIYDQGYPEPSSSDSIVLRRGCWIGACSILLPGVEVGENAVVGAGTIVTRSVPARTVFAGNPGRVLRTLPDRQSPSPG